MNTVNPYFLHTLLEPITGLADDDDAVIQYRNLDPNDERWVRQVIRELIVPRARSMLHKLCERVKLAYKYYLSKQLSAEKDVRFDRVFNSILPPFDAPNDPRQFFVWIWEECFPGESYGLTDLENYTENPDINEPMRI